METNLLLRYTSLIVQEKLVFPQLSTSLFNYYPLNGPKDINYRQPYSNVELKVKSPMCSHQCKIYSQNILQTHSHHCISREQFRVVESDLHVKQEHWSSISMSLAISIPLVSLDLKAMSKELKSSSA